MKISSFQDEKDQERPDFRDGEMIFHGVGCGFVKSGFHQRRDGLTRTRIGDAEWKSSSVAGERLELRGSRIVKQYAQQDE